MYGLPQPRNPFSLSSNSRSTMKGFKLSGRICISLSYSEILGMEERWNPVFPDRQNVGSKQGVKHIQAVHEACVIYDSTRTFSTSLGHGLLTHRAFWRQWPRAPRTGRSTWFRRARKSGAHKIRKSKGYGPPVFFVNKLALGITIILVIWSLALKVED